MDLWNFIQEIRVPPEHRNDLSVRQFSIAHLGFFLRQEEALCQLTCEENACTASIKLPTGNGARPVGAMFARHSHSLTVLSSSSS